MGWAGSQILASTRHVALPRRWVWLWFEEADWEERDVDGARIPVAHHCRLAHSHVVDGRMRHGGAMRATPDELWAIFDHWAPRRGNLWVWTAQPALAPWGVGLDCDAAGAWGWTRGHTRWSDDICTVEWRRSKTRVKLATAQGAIRQFDRRGRSWLDAMRDDVLAWATAVEHLGLGRLRATVGAQAWEAYRARWCDGSLWAGGSDAHKAIAREAIAGGIAVALQTGYLPGEWTEVDMSRCYRTVMRDEELPMRAVSRLRRPAVPVLARAVERDCVIATVELTERGWLAAERDEYGRLHWSGGPGLATMTTPDLADALRAGVVAQVHELCTWTRGRPLARLGAGLEALEASLPADLGSVVSAQVKPLANAVYGRMCMPSRRWRQWDRVDDAGLRTWSYWNVPEQRWERYRQIGPVVEREERPGEHRWGHCAAAAHIAAHGRARLRRMVDRAGYVHTAYVDTDGCIVDEEGLMRLQDSDMWDEFNLRIAASGSCDIRGVRDYDIGHKRVKASAQPGR